MPDQDQIQESPERHQKLQHLHDLMVDQAIKALETEEQPNASMLRTCLEVLKANDVRCERLGGEDPSIWTLLGRDQAALRFRGQPGKLRCHHSYDLGHTCPTRSVPASGVACSFGKSCSVTRVNP